jgi:hypothetical protein
MRYPAIKKPAKKASKKATTPQRPPDWQRSARPAAEEVSGQPDAPPG